MIIGGIIGTYLLSIGDMAVFGFNSAFLRTPIAVESVRMDMKDNLNCITGNLRNFQSCISPSEQTFGADINVDKIIFMMRSIKW